MRKRSLLLNLATRIGTAALALLCWSTTMSAQEPPLEKVYSFDIAKPVVSKPKEVTPTSFKATWHNVDKSEIEADVWNTFRIEVTHEFEAKADGVYPIANAEIKGATQTVPLSTEGMFFDKYLSQYNWGGRCVSVESNAVRLSGNAPILSSVPDNFIGAMAYIFSPNFDLSHNGGKFTFKFTAKTVEGTGEAKIKVTSYRELDGTKTAHEVKDLTIGTEAKEYVVEFTKGGWCQMITIEAASRHAIDFTGAFKVEQELKKGEKSFRTVHHANLTQLPPKEGEFSTAKYGDISVTEIDPKNDKKSEYSATIDGLIEGMIDVEAAKQRGERIAYRVSNCHNCKWGKWYIQRSLYSGPSYFDEQPSEENKYLYVGYCNYEDPDYARVMPGSVSSVSNSLSYAAAMKATKELLQKYVGAEVVGLRICVAASTQYTTDHKFKPNIFYQDVPAIFLASRLRSHSDETYTEETKTQYIDGTYTPTEFEDGWNTIFFKQPYEIKADEEFYAGAWVTDNSNSHKAFVLSLGFNETTKPKYTSIFAFNYSDTSTQFGYDYTPFTEMNLNEAWLLQLVIKPKAGSQDFDNKGTITDLRAEELYYDNEVMAATINFENKGIKTVNSLELKVSVAGKEETKTISGLNIPASSAQDIEFIALKEATPIDNTEIVVTLTKINGVEVENVTLKAATKVIDHTKVFPRTTMVEYFTTEACSNCPATGEHFFGKFQFEEFKQINSRVVTVAHHYGSVGEDFLTHQQSKELAKLYGVNKEDGNYRSAATPNVMLDRTHNKYLKMGNDNSPVASMGYNLTDFRKLINHTVYRQPAYGRIGLKHTYNHATKKLTVEVEGKISDAIDARPVYVSYMLIQKQIKARQQKGDKGEIDKKFVHHNVFRYIDEAGFQGTPVTKDAEGKFTMTKEIDLKTCNAGEKPKDGEILLEDLDKMTPTDVEKFIKENVEVVAFLHYYKELEESPDPLDVSANKNEIINVASSNVKEPTTLFPDKKIVAIDAPVVDNEEGIIYVQEREIRVKGAYDNIRVFALDGTAVAPRNLADGVYVVRVTMSTGRVVTAKVVMQ